MAISILIDIIQFQITGEWEWHTIAIVVHVIATKRTRFPNTPFLHNAEMIHIGKHRGF
jgi:hypothetical protein